MEKHCLPSQAYGHFLKSRGLQKEIPSEWAERYTEEVAGLTRGRIKYGGRLILTVLVVGVSTRLLAGHTIYEPSEYQSMALMVWISLCIYLGGLDRGPRWPNTVACLLVSGCILECVSVVYATGGILSGTWPSLILVLLGAPLLFPLTALQALGFASLACVLYGASIYAAGQPATMTTTVFYQTLVNRLVWLFQTSLVSITSAHFSDQLRRKEFLARLGMEEERSRADQLLLNVLPESVALRLKTGETQIADRHEEVSVLFADIVGFTPLSSRKTPEEMVSILDQLFRGFDQLASQHGLEKIKTIGDCYMVVAGVPRALPNHSEAAARMALDMLDSIQDFNRQSGESLSMRIGLHAGPVVAGVIGESKFSYDLWGDTVNIASRMESHGETGQVQSTAEFGDRLGEEFQITPRGSIEVKGKGTLDVARIERNRCS